MLRVLSLMCFVFSCYGAVPPFITPCKSRDSACMLSSARAAVQEFAQGVPALGIKSLDPLHIPLIKNEQNGLKMKFKDSILTGMKSCIIESAKIDLIKMKQFIRLKCNLVMTGSYTLKGQVLILPVEGEGKFKMDFLDSEIKVHVDIEPVTSSGVTHWHISNWRQSTKVLTGVKFEFENLFNGNKNLSEPVLEFINTNWKDVMQEFAPPISEAIAANIIEAVQAFYAAVPVDEIVLQ